MPSQLIPEVAELIRAGKLPAWDGEWIRNLEPAQQLAAALKFATGTSLIKSVPFDDLPRSALNGRKLTSMARERRGRKKG